MKTAVALILFLHHGVRLSTAGESYSEILKPYESRTEKDPNVFVSEFYVLWSAQVEIVPITEDAGGWEPSSLHEKLAAATERGWKDFRDRILPGLVADHSLRQMSPREAFTTWQERLYMNQGDVNEALRDDKEQTCHVCNGGQSPPATTASTWPEMESLYEYGRIRKIVDRLAKRFAIRAGVDKAEAKAVNYSVYNWQTVSDPYDVTSFEQPQTHTGAHLVGLFYARAGNPPEKLRFSDPRGQSPPYGQVIDHEPKTGEIVLLPQWVSYMHRMPENACNSDECRQIVFTFKVVPEGAMSGSHMWSDPTGDMKFQRRTHITRLEMNMSEVSTIP